MHPEKCRPFPGVLYLAPVERFTAAPRPGNAINEIIYTVFNTLDFKPIQAAIPSVIVPVREGLMYCSARLLLCTSKSLV